MVLEKIRYPVAAGVLYPSDEYILEDVIDSVSKTPRSRVYHGEILTAILPHDEYSIIGKGATRLYKILSQRTIERIFLIGDMQLGSTRKIILDNTHYWRTPFGEVPVDTDTIEDLCSISDDFITNISRHSKETLLEVQLPFLQYYLDYSFSIVPILCGKYNASIYEKFADYIAKVYNYEEDIIILSTNLSQGNPTYMTKDIDKKSLDILKTFNIGLFEEKIKSKELNVTSPSGLLLSSLISLILGAPRIEHFDNYNSASVTGDNNSVRGYFTAGLIK